MTRKTEYDRFFDLLPDYVRGDLHELTRREFEEALGRSTELQQALEREQRIAGEVRAQAASDLEVIDMTTDKRHDDLAGKLTDTEQDSQPVTRKEPYLGSSSGAGSALSFLNPKNWRPAVALSVFAMGMSGVAAAQAMEIDRLEEENYQLASGCEEKSEAALIVEFSEEATWPEITSLLAGEKLAIIKTSPLGAVELSTLGNAMVSEGQLERLRSSTATSAVDLAK